VHRAFSSNRYRAHRAFYRPPGLHQPHQVPFNLNKVILNRLRFCTIKGIAIGIFTITFECVVKFFADILLFHSHVLFRIQQVTRIFALPNDRRSRLQTQLRFICSIPCQSTIMKLSPCLFSGVGFREKSFTVPAAPPRIIWRIILLLVTVPFFLFTSSKSTTSAFATLAIDPIMPRFLSLPTWSTTNVNLRVAVGHVGP